MPFSAAAIAAATASHALDVEQALSGVFGSISLASWICLLLPQLITNYKAKSADGLSMGFLFIWLGGDITNLLGALFASLAPTAIAIGCYFCIADIVLIGQCSYYNAINRKQKQSKDTECDESRQGGSQGRHSSSHNEDEPLLARRRSSSVTGAVRQSTSSQPGEEDLLSRELLGPQEAGGLMTRAWLRNTVSLFAVYLVGTVGWVISWRVGAWDSDADPGLSGPEDEGGQEALAIAGLVLGYASAICYLLARVPQIIKNYRDKSCEGLSLLFFLLSVTGNLTYGASLVAYSQDKDYILRSLPWLIGSLGTIVEDCIIFIQFHLYSPDSNARQPTRGDPSAYGTNGDA